ncbi:HalOD1 output domain-containing protein [Haloprofundus halobius]|uniref:HalOD1 output domain-containing protein n=1 Tax=Haloprofundus halobius TaxID=2876194 RepID=UPI001CCA139A|nr:HalOD1 output domain-containing protein [Haloprofundus halobius]
MAHTQHQATLSPDTSASVTLIQLISSCENIDPAALDPLYQTVDTEALDELVASLQSRDEEFAVQFTYQEYEVIIQDNEITATPASATADTTESSRMQFSHADDA